MLQGLLQRTKWVVKLKSLGLHSYGRSESVSVATRKTVLHTTNTKLSDRGKTENEFKEFIGTILKKF